MRSAMIVLACWTVVAAGPARSAEIVDHDNPEMGCIAKLTGPIAAGDAAKLRALLQKWADAGTHSEVTWY